MLKQTKAYKARDPFETIQIIRQLFFKMDEFIFEDCVSYVADGIYANKLSIGDIDERLRISSGGKGTTRRYSLASAYGELIERIQNSVLLPIVIKPQKDNLFIYIDNKLSQNIFCSNLIFDFQYAPDEKKIGSKEIAYSTIELFSNIFGNNTELYTEYLDSTSNICVPFYSLDDDKLWQLPKKLLFDFNYANGMCAGNTNEEALIHGICEIIERFSLAKIFFDKITPPTIPLEVFDGFEISTRIQTLEKKYELELLIKDCSLGMGLPVVGLLIIDYVNERFSFNLASDPSPITALERCVNEQSQSGFLKVLQPMHKTGTPIIDNLIKKNRRLMDYYNIRADNSGSWDKHIYSDIPSYNFSGFEYEETVSDKVDLKYLIKKVQSMGFKILIRDVSFLGFPSFHIFIPGMSDNYFSYIDSKEEFIKHRISSAIEINNILNLYKLNNGQKMKLVYALDNSFKSGDMKFIFYADILKFIIPPKQIQDLYIIYPQFLIAILFFELKEYRKAYEYIQCLFEAMLVKKDEIECMQEYFKLLADNVSLENIVLMLKEKFSDVMVCSLLLIFSSSELMYEEYFLPRCFDCKNCIHHNNCGYVNILEIQMRIFSQMKTSKINQIELRRIFHD